MEAEQAPPPSSSAPSSSSSAPSSSSSITDSVPTSSSPFSNVAPTSSPSFSTTLVSATTTTMATSTAASDSTATITTTTTTTQMIDIPPILGATATATTSTSTGETNSLTSTSISSSTTAPTAATTISTTTTTITTSPFSTFDHQPPSNALPLRPSFPINRNRPQMPPPIPPPHFAQHLPSPSPPPLPFSSSSPASSSSVGVPSLLASSSSSSSSLSSSSSSSSPSPPPSATSPSSSSSPLQRGGLAIGVPAYPPRPQSTSLLPSSTFGSPPFGHQLGSLGRISDQTQSASPQVRPGMQGIQTIGMMGALSGSQIRPGAAAAHLPPRPAQQQLRPQSPSSSQPSAPQIDPLERLDPEVEDVLAEIADDFVESITTFACSLAKHRKSTTLEAKDILLHMDRNWNMTLPGFSADEIKIFKKPPVNDIHKQRMVAIKKSYITTQAMAETANVKGSSGQVPGNVKGHPGKVGNNFVGMYLGQYVRGFAPSCWFSVVMKSSYPQASTGAAAGSWYPVYLMVQWNEFWSIHQRALITWGWASCGDKDDHVEASLVLDSILFAGSLLT
ncbi:Transcription initiation factor TFIID subunit 12 [Nymphaea thermarum]|nr:Transcription initiation factor TFIID subunit 12 [Nymphaea thermarum]